MIVSVSRRTDIPAFYGDWFMNRLRAGFALVVNPFNRNAAYRVSLRPADVDCLVFWTKNAAPFVRHLDEIDHLGFRYGFLFTINNYPTALEPGVPPVAQRLRDFQALADSLGPNRVIWRYDPIVFSAAHGVDFHLATFELLASALAGYTSRVIVSVLDWYRKTERRMSRLEADGVDRFVRDPWSAPGLAECMRGMGTLARRHGMHIQSCSEDPRLAEFGVPPGKCIDAEWLHAVCGIPLPVPQAAGQRNLCGCVEARDIGAVDSCRHGCAYCYSTASNAAALTRAARHDPENPFLVAEPKGQAEPAVPHV